MHDKHRAPTVLRVTGTTGKALVAATAAAGSVAAVVVLFGVGILGVAFIAGAAVIAAVGVFADARLKALKEREAQHTTERARDRALLVGVCTVAEVRIEDVGVDAVDPRVLERARQVEGDQLPYITRGEVDVRLRKHLAQAREGTGPALVCLYGPSKAGKSRSMLQALQAELPDAAIVAPARTRENLDPILNSEVLQEQRARTTGSRCYGSMTWKASSVSATAA